MRTFTWQRHFRDLGEQEVLALAISSEEDTHRRRLIALHERRFGPTIPLIRREHVAGCHARRPVWLIESLGIERIRAEA